MASEGNSGRSVKISREKEISGHIAIVQEQERKAQRESDYAKWVARRKEGGAYQPIQHLEGAHSQKEHIETPSIFNNAVQGVLHVPLSNHGGPGNKIQEPNTIPDVSFQKHDLSKGYNNPSNYYETQNADTELQRELGNNVVENISLLGNPIELGQSLIGLGGITAKKAVESALGKSLYPSISGTSCLLYSIEKSF